MFCVTEKCPGGGQRLICRLRPGQSEIEQCDLSGGRQFEIVRLNVAMDDLTVM
jgi:hypothetical protein